jgi:hypothetical protein
VDGLGVLGVPEGQDAGLAAPGAGGQRRRAGRCGLSLEKIRFRYAVSGSNPPWKPLRAFDDGEKVYIQFPPGIAQGELPPLFVIGAQGDGQLVNYRFRPPYYIVDRLFGAAELRLGGDGGDVVRIERTDGVVKEWEELTMSQDDTPDLATPQAGKVAPEAVALRAQPRPVTRLNRRTLAILAGGLSVAVLGALMWSLQPQRRGANEQTELYNVDRVSKSEGLDALPADYSKLPPKVPELGPPLPGDLGPAIVKSQQPVTAAYAAPGHDPNDALRKEAEAAAASSVFFRSGSQKAAPVAQTQVAAAPGFAANAAFDPLAAGPASTAAQPADPTAVQNRQDQKEAFLKAGTYGNPQFWQSDPAGFAVSGHGRNGDRRGAADGHQVGLAGRRDRHGDGAGL